MRTVDGSGLSGVDHLSLLDRQRAAGVEEQQKILREFLMGPEHHEDVVPQRVLTP